MSQFGINSVVKLHVLYPGIFHAYMYMKLVVSVRLIFLRMLRNFAIVKLPQLLPYCHINNYTHCDVRFLHWILSLVCLA